jgi:serine/threonine protein kinase/Tfp pilus assembly protein PilF/TolA-binding protein
MKCPVCQSENPADSQYCNKCGSAFELTAPPTLTYTPAQETTPSQDLNFNPGEKFGDRYTIIEEIGQGGMGRVYKAMDHELGTTIVLKMIRPELNLRPGMLDQFRKETLLGRSVSQENVVRIHDLGEVNKVRYISMDFIKGENLAELIRTSGSLTLSTCLQIALQVCRALKAAHEKGIVHQDLKPQNIMIDNSGKVYVTDFGLARSVSVSPAHRPGKISGTPKYFSPEQARGEESDQRSDVYSLGVILYEMVTGTAPFKADTIEGYIKKHASEKPVPPSKFNLDLPPACEKIILKCLEKKKEDRYQSVDELIKDLEAQKAHIPTTKTGIWQKVLAASGLILAVGVALYELVFRPRPPAPPAAPGRIAVMYAVNNSGDKSLYTWLRWVIPAYLGADLAQSKYLSVLPQEKLMQILTDMGQYNDERPLSRTLERISREANIAYIILPSFIRVGDDFRINCTVSKAGGDEKAGQSDQVKGKKLEDVLSMVDELSSKVKLRLNLSPAEIARETNQDLAKITSASVEAVQHYVEAQELYAQGEFRASTQALEKAVNEDTGYAMAYRLMAIDYEYLNDYGNFRKYLQKALALTDRVSERDRYYIQGYAATMLNESPLPAIEIYRKLISLYPEDEEAYTCLGAIYREGEEWELALAQFEKVQSINPANPFIVENKSYLYTAMGRYQEAMNLCYANRESILSERFCARQLPLLFLVQGQYDRAFAELEKSLAHIPDDLYLTELKGIIHLLNGDIASARRVFEQVQKKDESDPNDLKLNGRLWLARIHLLQGEYRQAWKEVSGGIELAHKAGRVYEELDYRSLLAYMELQLRQFSLSIGDLKPILDIAKKTNATKSQMLALNFFGLAYLGMGRIEEAKKIAQQLRQIIEITSFPKSMRYYDHLTGQIVLEEGHPDQAVYHFGQAISLLPYQREINDEHAFYYDGLAAACYKSGNWPKAIEAYKAIISLTTGRLCWGDIYARSHYWLGKSYQKVGNSIEARTYYQAFLRFWENADSGLPEAADAKKELDILGRGH